jgi:hypothetical protein
MICVHEVKAAEVAKEAGHALYETSAIGYAANAGV